MVAYHHNQLQLIGMESIGDWENLDPPYPRQSFLMRISETFNEQTHMLRRKGRSLTQ
jgi:hypothetical protein